MSNAVTESSARSLQARYEAHVPVGWRATTPLVITPGRVQWGEHLVVLEAVTGVGWASRSHAVNLTQTTHERLVRFQHRNGSLDIRFGHGAFGPANDPIHNEAYARLLELVTDVVEPRLRADMLDRLSIGDPVEVAGLLLSASGIHHHDRRNTVTPWSAGPVARVVEDHVEIRAPHGRQGTKVVLRRPTRAINAGLLPGIFSSIGLGIA